MQLADLMQGGFVTVPRGAWLLPEGAVRNLYLALFGRAWRIRRPGILRNAIEPGEVDTTWAEIAAAAGVTVMAARAAADELRRRGLLTWCKRRNGRSWFLSFTLKHFETLAEGHAYGQTRRQQPNNSRLTSHAHANVHGKGQKMQEVSGNGELLKTAEQQPNNSPVTGSTRKVLETKKQRNVSRETCFFCEGTGTETSGAPCRVKCAAWQRLQRQGAADGAR